jgi:hypothetical protein
VAGIEVDDPRPELLWTNASDPQGDALTYDVEVYADASMTTLLDSATGLVEGTASTSWTPDVPLPENADAHWRARADDAATAGTWSALDVFFVNAVQEPPDAPTPLFPVGGESVAELRPTPQWSDAVDPDRDAVTYEILVKDSLGEPVTEGFFDPAARDAEWTVDVELVEDAMYSWQVRALDEHGLEGSWSADADFVVDTDNAPPSDVVFVDPLDGDSVDGSAPTLVATEAVDPEGEVPSYVMELDTVESFDSADLLSATLEHTGTGTVDWVLADEGVELAENGWWNARVRSVDPAGVGSAWDVMTFYVRGHNDAPPVPALLSPEDGASSADRVPVLALGHVVDPEGDAVTYDVQVLEGGEVLARIEGLVAGAGPSGTADQTSWRSAVALTGTVLWTARAVDDQGEASEWAEPFEYTVTFVEPLPPGDEVPDCGCEAAAGTAQPSWLLLLLLLGVRRGRPSYARLRGARPLGQHAGHVRSPGL